MPETVSIGSANSLPPSLRTLELAETVDLSGTAAASFPIVQTLPAGCTVIGASVVLSNAAGGATSTKVGVGRTTATAAPSKYLLTAGKTAGGTSTMVASFAVLATTESLGIFACDNAGAAAGTIGGVVGLTAKVCITYMVAAVAIIP